MIIPQRWLSAQLSEGLASLFKGGLHFGGVTSIFWLGNGSGSWAFWVVLLCESFLFRYTQIWGFSHIGICLWWENCHLRRKVLVWGRSGGVGQGWKCRARGTSTVPRVLSPTPSTLLSQRYQGHWREPRTPALSWILAVRASLLTACLWLARRACFPCFRCEFHSDATSLFLGGFFWLS